MTTQDFNAANEIGQIRGALGKRIGEIISYFVGDDRLKEMFENNNVDLSKHAGKPSGIIALDEKIVTRDQKDMLLAAQAAERTLAIVAKIEALAANHATTVMMMKGAKSSLDLGKEGFQPFDHPDFKFVGGAKDIPVLQKAQSAWMTAQMLLNQEITAVNNNIANFNIKNTDDAALDRSKALGYAQGLKHLAVAAYKQAAFALREAGLEDAGIKINVAATAVGQTIGDNPGLSPAAFLKEGMGAFDAKMATLINFTSAPGTGNTPRNEM